MKNIITLGASTSRNSINKKLAEYADNENKKAEKPKELATATKTDTTNSRHKEILAYYKKMYKDLAGHRELQRLLRRARQMSS